MENNRNLLQIFEKAAGRLSEKETGLFRDAENAVITKRDAVNRITVKDRVNESITDWYPQIVFYLSDGTASGVRFEAHWLCIGGMENYEIDNAEEFWSLTASLVLKYAGQ